MNTRDYNSKTALSHKLYLCTQEAEIDNLFNQFAITNISARIDYLRRSMGVDEIYDFNQEPISETEQYEFEKEAFVEGSWRLLS